MATQSLVAVDCKAMQRLLKMACLLLLVSVARADSIATIQLQHRPAEEVITIVQPMLKADDAISGQGFKIFLRSSPETLELVKGIVDVVDIPARILQVSVFQGSERDLGALGASASVRVERGDASVEIGNERDRENVAGGSVTYNTTDASASGSAISTQKSLRDNPIHKVRVSEGNEAYIETGERIPYFYSAAWIGPRGFAGGVQYKDAVTGFYVLPRIRGDNVVLEVSPFKSTSLNTGRENFDTQSASTTITGRVGQWLLIGGITERVERSQSATGTTVVTQGRDDSGIWIKADLVQ